MSPKSKRSPANFAEGQQPEFQQDPPKREATPSTLLREVSRPHSPEELYSSHADGSPMLRSDGTAVRSTTAIPGGWTREVRNSPYSYASEKPNFRVPTTIPASPGGFRAFQSTRQNTFTPPTKPQTTSALDSHPPQQPPHSQARQATVQAQKPPPDKQGRRMRPTSTYLSASGADPGSSKGNSSQEKNHPPANSEKQR